nr:YciI family protein [Agromyces archimandritae]
MLRGGELVVSDGPLTEAKEWIAGLDLLDTAGLADAVSIAARHPMARAGTIELRPLWPLDVHADHAERTRREAAESAQRTEPRLTTGPGASAPRAEVWR